MQQGIDRRGFVLGWFPALFHRDHVQLCGVTFRVAKHGHSPRRNLVIHGDEDTARDVLTAYMRDHAGVAYIVTGKERNVALQGLKIDPNRMYSRVGAERSLRSLNPGASPDAVLQFLDSERPRMLSKLTPGQGSRLFAMHNNRNYSVQDELAASDETSIKEPQLPRNFFLCTDQRDFAILKQSPYNVVLQTQAEPDDGSMSRYAARTGFRYINLECAIGEYEAQMERVRWLDEHLP